MTSHTEQQLQYTYSVYLSSKRNQVIKFGLLIYRENNLFFKIHVENEVGRLVPELLLFFKKALHKVKSSGQHLSVICFSRLLLRHTMRTNFITFQTVDLEISSILIFYKMV